MSFFRFSALKEPKYRLYVYFSSFVVLFVSLMTFVEIRNGKFWTNDLRVYVSATSDFFSDHSPYEKAYGLTSGLFKYPPTTLWFFWSSTLFSYFTVQLLHVLTGLSSLLIIFIALHKKVFYTPSRESVKRAWILWLTFVFVAIHLVREFHMGNINLQLLALFVFGWLVLNREKPLFTAFLWSIVILFKPFMILLLLPLIFQYRKLVWQIGLIGAFFVLFSFITEGVTGFVKLWNDWLAAIIRHGDYQVNHDSFESLVKHYVGWKSEWIATGILFLIIATTLVLDQFKFKRLSAIEWTVVILAATPTLFKTDTQHFMFSLPLIYVLMSRLLSNREMLNWIVFAVLMCGFSLNSNDLLGKHLGVWVTENGILGISNLGLILFYLILSWKKEIPQYMEHVV